MFFGALGVRIFSHFQSVQYMWCVTAEIKCAFARQIITPISS